MRAPARQWFAIAGLAAALIVAGCQRAQRPATQLPPPAGSAGPGANPSALHQLTLPVPRRDDLSHIDPAQFAAALGGDPQRIFVFVRDGMREGGADLHG